jgi:Rrf2 family protein
MIYLAKQPAGKVSFTADIAEAEHIPPSFLVKVVPRLVKAGLVISRRGSSGGLELARAPESITLRQMVEAMEGEIASNVCTSTTQAFSCFRDGCSLRGAFYEAQRRYLEALEGVTLGQLIAKDAYHGDRPPLFVGQAT